MGTLGRCDPTDVVVDVLRELFDCTPLTEGAAIPVDLRELAFTREATRILIHHGHACGSSAALLVANELLDEPVLEVRLRAADLPALVAKHPRGIVGVNH